MAVRTEAEAREWAKAKCEAWNWNANVAEIARELINEEIEIDGGPFATLGEEFVRFFGGGDEAKNDWDIIRQIMEEFGE
jgi:hypothetical protein